MMNITSEQSTKGMSKIIEIIKTYKVLPWHNTPEILLIVPPIVDESWNMASQLFRWWTQKWNELIQSYKTLAQNENVLYLDPTTHISVDKNEGVHLDSKSHQKLAELIYEAITQR
jgi:lysophospholipase L1-like esterase